MDVLVGEPPECVHPVVAMGRVLSLVERHAPSSQARRFVYGAAAAMTLPLAWGAVGWLIERVAPWQVRAILLKSVIAGYGLLSAGRQVENSLRLLDLSRARNQLRALVSRPTHELDESLIAAAAIESLAENLADSWVAPLMAYAVFGLGGACFYRAANTADAMWGYHTPRYEWLGKGCARVDDALNWIPSRTAAQLLIVSGPRPGRALRVFLRDRGRTRSPNAGQVMAACAGQLNVRLEKPGHYVLNADGRAPTAQDIRAARRLVARAMLLGAVLAFAVRRWLRA